MKMLFSEECYQKMCEKASIRRRIFTPDSVLWRQCIRKLEHDQRQLLQLRYQDNVPVKEISRRSAFSAAGL
jgi:DNA-directed RNA polymerase specialized sigma24 family protein